MECYLLGQNVRRAGRAEHMLSRTEKVRVSRNGESGAPFGEGWDEEKGHIIYYTMETG